MAFNIFATKRDSCFGQYDRVDDLITCKLSGDKSPVVRQFEVDKFNFSAVVKYLDPRFVLHFRISIGARLLYSANIRGTPPKLTEFPWGSKWDWAKKKLFNSAGVFNMEQNYGWAVGIFA
jgi:hypothetical protein